MSESAESASESENDTNKYDPIVPYQDSSLPHDMLGNLREFQKTGCLTDISLQSNDGHVVRCHRLVLSAASPYFQKMFHRRFRESTSPSVTIKLLDKNTLQAVVDYIYGEEVTITEQNVQDLVRASEHLQFQGLKKACEDYMVCRIEPFNCVGLFLFGGLYRLKSLQKHSRKHMLQNFKEVARCEEFITMEIGDLIDYISDDELDVLSEDPVFEVVMTWLNHDVTNRKQYLPRLLEIVRLAYCSNTYLCDVVLRCPYLRDGPLHRYVEEAVSFQMLPEQQRYYDKLRMRPRKGFVIGLRLVALGGMGETPDCNNRSDGACTELHYFKGTESQRWQRVTTLPRHNWLYMGICAVDKGLLITGGYDHGAKFHCWCFDGAERRWRQFSPLTLARYKHTAIAHGDHVYVLGGQDNDEGLRDVECLDLRALNLKSCWHKVPSMPKGLIKPSAVSFGRKIYVMGGQLGDGSFAPNVFAYDPVWHEWAEFKNAPEVVSFGSSVVALGDYIYLVGGMTPYPMRYWPQDDTWTQLTGMPAEAHIDGAAVVWEGKILLSGGTLHLDIQGTSTSDTIEEYNVEEDSWKLWPATLFQPLRGHCMTTMNLHSLGMQNLGVK